MIIDGRVIAAEILASVKTRATALPEVPSFLAIAIAPNPATQSYLRMKGRQALEVGIQMELREYPDTISTDDLIQELQQVKETALIIQLPLPEHIDTQKVLDAIPTDKDADVLSRRTRELFDAEDETTLMHPVAAAINAVLEKGTIDPGGKRVAIVGEGWLVGSPAASWLRSVGANVETVTRESGNLEAVCKEADIVVTGAGSPGIITPELVREGAAVIDIGTSELGGSIAGDVDPRVADKAGLFTPVPGGVGPITVAFLLSNVVQLAEQGYLQSAQKDV